MIGVYEFERNILYWIAGIKYRGSMDGFVVGIVILQVVMGQRQCKPRYEDNGVGWDIGNWTHGIMGLLGCLAATEHEHDGWLDQNFH